MPRLIRTVRFAILAAALATGAVGCRSLPAPHRAPPPLPEARPGAARGASGVLLEQMHQMAAEDAKSFRH
jgi:hypothetical protein